MKNFFRIFISFALCLAMLFSFGCGCVKNNSSDDDSKKYADDDLTSYYQLKSIPKGAQDDYYVKLNYFPNYGRHNNAYNTEGYDPFYETEWGIVSRAEPRFKGHVIAQPAWGYTNASDPKVMAKKIDAMVDFGIDCVEFDWYWFKEYRLNKTGCYKDGTDGMYFSEELEYGFLQAENCTDLDFSLIWCNEKSASDVSESNMDAEEFEIMTDYIIEHYFTKPNYSKRDGKLVFTIFYPQKLVNSFKNDYGQTDIRVAKRALKNFRQKVRDAGLGELYLITPTDRADIGMIDDAVFNSIYNGGRLVDEDGTVYDITNWNTTSQAKYLGFDGFQVFSNPEDGDKQSVQCYKSGDNGAIIDMASTVKNNFTAGNDGKNAFERIFERWRGVNCDFIPGWAVGRDVTPRVGNANTWNVSRGYPHNPVTVNNTPELLQEALLNIRTLMDIYDENWVIIGSWNEWGEGWFVEPDTVYGYGRLRAIQSVFG